MIKALQMGKVGRSRPVSRCLVDLEFDSNRLHVTGDSGFAVLVGDTEPEDVINTKPHAYKQEVRLWANVLIQAVDDLYMRNVSCDKKLREYHKRKAVTWLKSNKKGVGSFNFIVEDIFGLNPDLIRENIFKMKRTKKGYVNP